MLQEVFMKNLENAIGRLMVSTGKMKSEITNILEKTIVLLSKIIIALLIGSFAQAQTATGKADTASNKTVQTSSTKPKKRVSLNFDDELVQGQYDAPEVLLMNSRKHIKYKDLFNTRNNYIDEIETNRGMFNVRPKK